MGAVKPADDGCSCPLEAPERNHYFHGQMLGVRQFQLETDYHSGKRWLLNRMVLGYGVVCGLGIRVAEGEEAIIVEPGLAIDRCGREIVVDQEAGPLAVPPHLLEEAAEAAKAEAEQAEASAAVQQHKGEDDEHRRRRRGLHVVLCYHECLDEPTAVLAGDCRDEKPCQPGLVRERYRIEFRPGCLPPRQLKLALPDVISAEGKVDYDALVRAVSEPCPCPEDPCIPLANLFLHLDAGSGRCRCRREVDLAVRPIVYGNDLLLQLILSAVIEAPLYRREK